MLLCLENYAKRKLQLMHSSLEKVGNFANLKCTYQNYKKVTQWKVDVDGIVKYTRSACSNRKMSRI